MMPGMMSGMHQMMAGNSETAKLVDRLVTGNAAIQAEKDPAVIQKKLAEQGALLKELQTRLQAQTQMMQQHMGGVMTGGDHKP
jgi:Fe-S cluster assembly scaffold protein SufB